MSLYRSELDIEAGIDEVARGCLAGPVYAAAVIWPKELDDSIVHPVLRDSKKLSKKKRDELREYIESNAIDFSVAFETNNTIDSINILKATHSAMHKAIKGLNVKPDFLLVDGNRFEPYFDEDGDVIEHECFIKGDDKYQSISAASILAKVYHDEYIEKLVEEEPELKVYGWEKNMCYGTKTHLDAIKEHGISKYHRKTFGICREYS